MSKMLELMQNFKAEAQKNGVNITLPPESSKTLKPEYLDLKEGEFLLAKFPFIEAFKNPNGFYQGGFVCAAFDEVFGPLSYMSTGRPCVTLSMDTRYIRPFTAKDEYIFIRAEVVSKTKNLILMQAKAYNREDKIYFTATMQSMIMN